MRFVLGYRHTGADLAATAETLVLLRNEARQLGHECYVTLLDEELMAMPELSAFANVQAALRQLDASDAQIFFVNSAQASLGMHFEAGYAYARQRPVFVLIGRKLESAYLEGTATHVERFADEADLLPAMRRLIAAATAP